MQQTISIFNEENIISLLYSYNVWWKTGVIPDGLDKPIKRIPYYLANRAFLRDDIRRIVLLSGARRTGKTTIMYQTIASLLKSGVSPKDILFISFDHPLLKMCSIDSVITTYRSNISSDDVIYCFFDEIQYSQDWNSWLKILYDTNPNIRIMATGSASPTIKSKAAESGLGRWTTIPIPTLSFFEYCELLGLPKPELPNDIKPTQLYLLDRQEQIEIMAKLAFLQPEFIRYLQVGGFPELALSKDDVYAQRILREDIVDKALKRDLPSIYEIRNVNDVEKVFLYLCYHSSCIINISTMAKEIKDVTRATIEKYIDYLESANLIYVSPLIDVGAKRILKAQSKIYISDAAIRNAVLMKDDIANDPAELGIVAETAVYSHIKSFNYDNITEIGYYRNGSKGGEIDIVVNYHKTPLPIMVEVKYREDTSISEKDPIVYESSEHQPNLVITKRIDDFGLSSYKSGKKIYRIPAPAFLYLLGYVQSASLGKPNSEIKSK
jgi:predicted AAA+ superfamily ATPase